MPRISQFPPILLALSPAGVANALQIRPDEVNAAVKAGLLTVRCRGLKRRILCSDVEAWVRSWPQPIKRKYAKRKVPTDG